MTAFLIICELLVLLLVISMVYSLAQLSQEYQKKLTDLVGDMALILRRIKELEKEIAKLKHAES